MKHIPTRMCIGCRIRLPQKELLRFSCKDRVIKKYIGSGRSFYICENCIKEAKKLKKNLSKICKKEVNLNLEKIVNESSH